MDTAPSVIGNINERKSKLKTQIGLNSIKQELASVFKDKESRTAVMGLVGLGIMAYFLSPEKKEKFEEETKEEIEELKASGTLTKKEEEDVEEYYEKVKETKKEDNPAKKKEEEVYIEEPPVIKTAKMRAINIDAINAGNRKKLAGYKRIKDKNGKKKWVINNKINPADRFKINDSVYNIGSYGAIKSKHLKDFKTFKNRICNVFQPKLTNNPKQQVKNSAKALSYCAIGVYQILPIHHFKKLGLSVQGEKGLENIYKFIRSKEMQKELNLKILTASARSLKGNIEAIAANYYSGKGKSYLKYLESNRKEEPEWMAKKQGKYRSIKYYSGKVRKYFAGFYGKDLKNVNPNNRSQMLALQKAIQKKETGYSSDKKTKSKISTV